MPRQRPGAQFRGGHRRRTASAADDRRQVEELMVRWRRNVPGREWERLGRRMGRTAVAARISSPLELGQRREDAEHERRPLRSFVE